MGQIDQLRSLASTASNVSVSSAQKLIFLVIISPFVELFLSIGELIDALFSIIIEPTKAFVDGIGALILAIIGGAADIISAGAGSAAQAFLTGIWSALGPLNYPLAIGTVLAGAWLMVQYFQNPETSDSPIGLFSGTDLPTDIFGTDEEE